MTKTNLVKVFAIKVCAIAAFTNLTGCGVVKIATYHQEVCKSHAYVQGDLADYITNRFHTEAPVRMAIVPFSVPVNLASSNQGMPDFGYTLAARAQREILKRDGVPIVEILARADWPGKAEEFFRGNFGAIAHARESDYDLVMVGVMERQRALNAATFFGKIIDVENGITVWFGKTTVESDPYPGMSLAYATGLADQRPDQIVSEELFDEGIQCLVEEMVHLEELPLEDPTIDDDGKTDRPLY